MKQANVNKLPFMIEHINRSIVHRSLMRSRFGSVTLFAIDDYESITEHKSTSDEFVYVVEGEIELILDGKSILLKKGSYQHIMPNTLHTVNGMDSGKIMLVIIRNNKG